MAHAGGKITLADINTEKPAETMAYFLEKGRVVVDKEALAVAQKAADDIAALLKKQTADGKTRAAAAKLAAASTGPTEAEIVEAIGKLDKGNSEHWTNGGSPQVAAIEGILGKQISAADRDAAWATMPESSN
jgi:hypothetical protein